MTYPYGGEAWSGRPQAPHPGPPPGWPTGYPAGYGYWPPPQVGTNGLAVASLVLGIIWLYWFGSILALVFGYVAKSQIRRSGQQGAGLATAGIVLGWVGIATLTLMIVVLIAAAATSGDAGASSSTSL